MNPSIYNEDYFERGIEKGISCYTNYRWIPELTIRMAMALIDFLGISRHSTILEFGCAKGYLVKAFRILWREAYGCDISEYAISHADPDVVNFVRLCNDDIVPFSNHFNLCIAKDVFEHISENELNLTLNNLRLKCDHLFAVIPLGDGSRFVVPAYNQDITHVTAKDMEWWVKKFNESGWKLDDFSYIVKGVKDNWSHYLKGNCFFKLS